jgi:hypothetical protein
MDRKVQRKLVCFPPSVAVIAHMSSNLPIMMPFFQTHHFRVPLYPFNHLEDGCVHFYRTSEPTEVTATSKHPSHEKQLPSKLENLIVTSLQKVKFQ